MARFRTLDDLDPRGKRVLLRADLNLPVKDGRITDRTRIGRALVGTAERVRSARVGRIELGRALVQLQGGRTVRENRRLLCSRCEVARLTTVRVGRLRWCGCRAALR